MWIGILSSPEMMPLYRSETGMLQHWMEVGVGRGEVHYTLQVSVQPSGRGVLGSVGLVV